MKKVIKFLKYGVSAIFIIIFLTLSNIYPYNEHFNFSYFNSQLNWANPYLWVVFSVTIILYILLSYDLFIKSFKAIKNKDFFNENTLMVLASIGALVIGELSEGLAVILLYKIGEEFEDYAVNRSKKEISSLVKLKSYKARIKENGEYVLKNINDIKINDKIYVFAGESVPLDIKLLSNSASIDQKALTGESLPVEKIKDEDVYSGSINLSNTIEGLVIKENKDSTISRIIKLIQESTANKSKSEKFITKFARIYTPIVITLSFLIFILGSSISFDWNKNKSHEFAVLFKWDLGNAWNLDTKAKYTWVDANYADFGGSSIMNVKDGKVEGNTNTYYDKNGKLYTGMMDGRRIWFHTAKAKSFLLTSEVMRNYGQHNLKIGLNEWNFDLNYWSASTQWDASVKEYPEFLSHSTVSDPTARTTYYGFNKISTDYAIGNENKLAGYFTDEWRPIESLRFFYGARLEWCRMSVDQLPYARFADMYVGATNADGVTITPQHRTKNKLNYAFTVSATWSFYKGMGLTADFTQMERSPRMTDYANMGPQDLRLRIPLLRGGIYYRNKWIDVTSMITWIQKTNNTDQQDITKPGTNISKTTSLNYSIQTVGWTTNVELDPFKGAHLHALFTYQKPTYKDYSVTVKFDDGETADLNATGNIVKEIPQILIELDPSYTFYKDKMTVWGSFRYFGKTYANLSNALWFNGHWETFAGVKWNATNKLSFNFGVVNFLNQKGASGTISGSELIGPEEAKRFNGYVMSGRYLRPFTVEFGASVKL